MWAVMTGARQGEILGLKWADLDLKNAQIHIQRTTKGGKFYAPKTAGSVRRVDLGPALVAELKKCKLACPRNALDLIFPNEVSKPIEPIISCIGTLCQPWRPQDCQGSVFMT